MNIYQRLDVKNDRDEDFVTRAYRILSASIIPILVKWKISPNLITYLSLLPYLVAGALLIVTTDLKYMFIAALLVQLGFFLDFLDGGVARRANKTTKFGEWLDGVIDTLGFVVLLVCIGVRMSITGGDLGLILSLVMLGGVFFNSYLTLNTKLVFGDKKLRERGEVKTLIFTKYGLREGCGTTRLLISLAIVTNLLWLMGAYAVYSFLMGLMRLTSDIIRFRKES